MAELDLSTALIIQNAILLLMTGAIAGVLAGLLGVGGGIVIVPVLFHLFGVLELPQSTAMHVAVGTSLAIIIPTSLSSMRAHFKKGSIDKAVLRRWAGPMFVGAAIGALISAYVSGLVLTTVFAVIAVLVAANMATPNGVRVGDNLPTSTAGNVSLSGVIGTFSAMMGIGGGTLLVPTFSAFNFPIHMAVGTAAALGLAIAVPGAAGFILSGWDVPDRPPLSIGYVNLVGFALIFPMTVLTAPWGAAIAHRLNRVWLRRAFALFLAVTAARMFWGLLS